MTFANNLDPDEAPQNVGLHLRSKLFDIQIIYQQNQWMETNEREEFMQETQHTQQTATRKAQNQDKKTA